MTSQIDRVQSAFTRQAPGFADPGLTLGREELLRWVVESLPLTPETRALDVAAGTGHLSRKTAPLVRSVAAVDVTPAMLNALRTEAEREGLDNLQPVLADAGHLPFADDRFDLVLCRLGLHHFADPAAEVAEMARVTRVSGTLAVVDLLSPDDADLAARYNAFERMRDPSHSRALTAGELRELLDAAGRPIDYWSGRDVEVALDPWLDLTGTPDSTRRTIVRALERELEGGPPTGMRPRRRGGRLSFVHAWALVQAGPRGGGRPATDRVGPSRGDPV